MLNLINKYISNFALTNFYLLSYAHFVFLEYMLLILSYSWGALNDEVSALIII